jgi:hypothetical protein
MNNFNELIKKFQELGLAQNNTKVDLPEIPKINTICRLYNNHFGLYNNTHMRECNHMYVNKDAVLLQIPYYMITGSAVLNRSKFSSFLSGGCMPCGWTKSTIEGLNYRSVESFLFSKRLFGVYGVHNNQPAYFVFSETIRDLVGEDLQEVLYEITGVADAYKCMYPVDAGCCCNQCYTSLGESKIDTKQFENKSVFEIAELFGEGCQVFVEENKLEIFNENNKYGFVIEKL